MPRMKPHEIRRLREAMKLDVRRFGELVGVSGATVSLWENGKRIPSRAAQMHLDRLLEQQKTGIPA